MTKRSPEHERIIRERDHVAMMKTPDLWGCWPFLPLKRRRADHHLPDTAVLAEFSDAPRTRVYLCNMWAFNPAVFKDYESAEAIVADGWEVD